MKTNQPVTELEQKTGRSGRRIPYRRIISVILILSLFFAMIPSPITAAQAEKKKQAQHFLSALQQALNATETVEEESSDTVEEVASPQEDTLTEEQESSDQESSEEGTSSSLVSISLDTPEGNLSYVADANGQLQAVTSEEDTRCKVEWGDFSLSTLCSINKEEIQGSDPVAYSYSLSEDCLLYFLLHNTQDKSKEFSTETALGYTSSQAGTFYGLAGYGISEEDDWQDADHDGICDDCGYCLSTCTPATEESYETLYPDIAYLLTPEEAGGGSSGHTGEGNIDPIVISGEDIVKCVYYVENDSGQNTFTYKVTDSSGTETEESIQYNTTLSAAKKPYTNLLDGNLYDYYIEDENGQYKIEEKRYNKVACDVKVTVTQDVDGELKEESLTVLKYLTYTPDGTVCSKCGKKIGTNSGCHMNLSQLKSARSMLLSLQEYLKGYFEVNKNTLLPKEENFDETDFLNTVFSSLSTTLDGINKDIAVLESIDSAAEAKESFTEDLDSFLSGLGIDSLSSEISSETLASLTPEEAVGTVEDESLNTSDSLYGMLTDAFTEYRAARAQETKNDKALKYYYTEENLAALEKDYQEKLLSVVTSLFAADIKALEGAIASTIDPDEPASVTVTPEQLKKILSSVEGKSNTELRTLLKQAESILSLVTDVEDTDAAYLLFLEEKDTAATLTGKAEDYRKVAEEARTTILRSLESSYTSPYITDGLYAVRSVQESDIARSEEYTVDGTIEENDLEEVIDRLDGFLSSEECFRMLLDLIGDKIGFGPEMLETERGETYQKGDTDQDGKVDLYDLVIHLLVTEVLTDETLTTLFKTIFGTLSDFLNNQLDGIITNLLKIKGNNVIELKGNGHYQISTKGLLNAVNLDILADILSYLGQGAELDLYINGAGTTKKLTTLLSQQIGMKVNASDFAYLLSSNGFTQAASVLKTCDWTGLKDSDNPDGQVLSFGISSAEEVQKLLSVLLQSFGKLSDMLFLRNNETTLDFSGLGRANLTGSFLFFVVLLDFNINPVITIDGFGLYSRVIVPALEALGVTDPGSSVLTSDASSISAVTESLWTQLSTLLKNIAEAPVSNLLSMLPNLAYYLEDGRLLSLLNYGTDYSFLVKDLAAQPQGLSDAADRIWDHFFDDWWDYLNPFLYAKYVAALAAYYIFQGCISRFEIDLDLRLILNLFDISITLSPNDLSSLFISLQDAIRKLANSLGLTSNYTYNSAGWGDYKCDLSTGGELVQNLEFYSLIKELFCSEMTYNALGFRLDQPLTLVFTLLNSLYYDEDCTQKVFELSSMQEEMLNDDGSLSLVRLSSLGTFTARKSAILYSSTAFYANTYTYIEGNAPDVLCYLLEILSAFLGKENAAQNIRGLLTICGLTGEGFRTTLTELHQNLESKAGFGLDELLGDCVSTENDSISLNPQAMAGKIEISRNNLLCLLCEAILSDGDYAPLEIIYSAYAEEGLTRAAYLSSDDESNIWTEDLARVLADDGLDFANDLLAALQVDLNGSDDAVTTLYELLASLPSTLAQLLTEKLGLEEDLQLSDASDLLTLMVFLLNKLSSIAGDNTTLSPLLKTAVGTDLTEWNRDYGYLFDEEQSAPSTLCFEALRGAKKGGKIVWSLNGSEISGQEDFETALSLLLEPLAPFLDLILCNKDLKLLCYDDGEKNLVTIGGCDGYNAVLLPLLEALFPQEDSFLTAEEMAKKGSVAGTAFTLRLILDCLDEIFSEENNRALEELTEMGLQLLYFLSGENGISILLIDLLQPIWNLYDALHPTLKIDQNALLERILYAVVYRLGSFTEEEADELAEKIEELNLDIRTLSIPRILDILSVLLSAKWQEGESSTRYYFCLNDVYDRFMADLCLYSCAYPSKSTVGDLHYRLNFAEEASGTTPALQDGNALTMLASLITEGLVAGKNLEIIGKLFGTDALATCKALLLGNYEASYSTDYQWDYPENSESKDAYEEIVNRYLAAYEDTDWTEEAVTTFIADTEDLLNQLLNFNLDDGPLAETIAEALKIDAAELQTGKADGYTYTLASVLSGIVENLLNRYFNDDVLTGLLLFVGDFLNPEISNEAAAQELVKLGFADSAALTGTFASLRTVLLEHMDTAEALTDSLGIDLAAFAIDGVTVMEEAGEIIYTSTSEERSVRLTRDMLKEDYSNLGTVLAQLLVPFAPLLNMVLLGEPYHLFYAASDETEGRSRGDSLLTIGGFEYYRYVFLPLLESMGCENLQSAAYYTENEEQNAEFLPDFFTAVCNLLTGLVFDEETPVLERLLDTLPGLIYYINANGLGITLQNLLAPLESILETVDGLEDLVGDILPGEEYIGASLLDDFTLGDILRTVFALLTVDESGKLTTDWSSVLSGLFLEGKMPAEVTDTDGICLTLNDTLYTLFENLFVGEHEKSEAVTSLCGYDFEMAAYSQSPEDPAELLTLLISGLLEFAEDDSNATFFRTILGENSDYYEALCNLFDLAKFRFTYPDLDWQLTDYADTQTLVSALQLTEAFRDMEAYGENWTPEMATELGEQLEYFIEDILYLLGLEINGTTIRSLQDLTSVLLGGSLYSDKVLNALAGLLGDLTTLLESSYIDGVSKTNALSYLQSLLGVDLSSWREYAEGGKYADGRSWGCVTENITPEIMKSNGQIFENALVELLSPLAPVLNILMANRDVSFFLDCDNAGVNTEDIQLTVYGAEGYKYAIIPLYEGLGISQSEITSPESYLEKAITDSDYAVRALVHPLVSKLNTLAQDTAREGLELLPELIYFINSDGLGTFIKSLGHSLYTVAAALEPALSKALGDTLVWEEVEGTVAGQTIKVPDLFATLQKAGLLDTLPEQLFGATSEEILAIYKATGAVYNEETGYERFDFNLIFSIAIAAVNHVLADNQLDIDISPLAVDLVNELSYGYVVSFDSLTGRTAYTMELDSRGSGECLGDLMTILLRLSLKFLANEDNLEGILQFLKLKAGLSDTNYTACSTLLKFICSYLGTEEGTQSALNLLYYAIYGISTVSGLTVIEYENLNTAWNRVVAKLCREGGPLAIAALEMLYKIAGDKIGDIVSPTEVAPKGLVAFFKQIVESVKSVVTSVKSLFGRLFR